MGYYALLDENNIVVHVFRGRDEDDLVEGVTNWEDHYAEITGKVCKRTSWNTSRGKHRAGGKPFRGNYAGVGMKFDPTLGEDGAFVGVQPFASWTLNKETFDWEPPKPYPDDDAFYLWDEEKQDWDIVTAD